MADAENETKARFAAVVEALASSVKCRPAMAAGAATTLWDIRDSRHDGRYGGSLKSQNPRHWER